MDAGPRPDARQTNAGLTQGASLYSAPPVRGDLNGLASTPYDGVAEIWFGTFDEAVSALTSEHYKAVIAKDEENFLDRSKTVFLFADERVIIDEERDC